MKRLLLISTLASQVVAAQAFVAQANTVTIVSGTLKPGEFYWGSAGPSNSRSFDDDGSRAFFAGVQSPGSDFPTDDAPAADAGSRTTSFAFDLAAVPESSTWALMAIGFVGLAAALSRRGKKNRLAPGIE